MPFNQKRRKGCFSSSSVAAAGARLDSGVVYLESCIRRGDHIPHRLQSINSPRVSLEGTR